MRKFLLCAVAAATLTPALATSAAAQPYGSAYGYRYNNSWYRGYDRSLTRECNRALRQADTRREYWQIMRECRREMARRGDGRYYAQNRYPGYDRGYDDDDTQVLIYRW